MDALRLDALPEGPEEHPLPGREGEVLASTCEIATLGGRYPLAWIGLAQDDPERRVVVAASAGSATAYLHGIDVRWDAGDGTGLAGQAIRTGAVQLSHRACASLASGPWRRRAAQHGLGSSIAIPLRLDHQVIGALVVYGHSPDGFVARDARLLEQVAASCEAALGGLGARRAYDAKAAQHASAAQRLERVLEQAVEALSEVLVSRDPYTAGHQRRVADIAVQIARGLGLSEDHCHVLHLAGLVHDIGKIRVPLEILTKPTRLRPQEVAVLQEHAQGTIDILAKIDWPWPLATIAGQHHERLDGSGYPRGLRGDEILLEARILAVADILESMLSPRPYRPAPGLAAALGVLRAERGTRLDPAVVDVALQLFGGEIEPPSP